MAKGIQSVRYSALDVVPLSTWEGSGLLYAPQSGGSCILPREAVLVLKACRGLDRLEDLATAVSQKLATAAGSVGSLTRILETAAAADLMLSEEGITQLLDGPSFTDDVPLPAVETIVIPTCDRTSVLLRSVASYAANGRRFGRDLRFLVSDDSRQQSRRTYTRQMLAALSRSRGIQIGYLGAEERMALAGKLSRACGVDPEEARSALVGPKGEEFRAGAARNVLLLLTRGERVVAADDDTICRIGEVPDSTGGVALDSLGDVEEFWHFEDERSALSQCQFSETDFVGCHQGLLGQTVGSIVRACGGANQVDIGTAGMRFLADPGVASLSASITACGSIGDSALPSSRAYLLQEGLSHSRLVSSADHYQRAIWSRQAIRGVKRTTISSFPFCAGLSQGWDNRELLPPFPPAGRGEDAVFNVVHQTAFPDRLFGYIPKLLLHRPPETRRCSYNEIWTFAARHRSCDLLTRLIASFSSWPGVAGQGRLQRLGSYLQDLASMPLRDFTVVLRSQCSWFARSILARIERLERVYGKEPDFWAGDLEQYKTAVIQAIVDGTAIEPIDLDAPNGEQRIAQFREQVGRYGRLLHWWPEFVAASGKIGSAAMLESVGIMWRPL